MTTATREHRLVDAFVALTDTLVADHDVVDLLQTLVDRVVEIVDASAAGILLASPQGELEVVASTDEGSALHGLLQLSAGEGPCIECFATGLPVTAGDRQEMHRRWPTYAAASDSSGVASVHAVPMRLRETTIGSLDLSRESGGALGPDDALAAQALADVATISILQHRSLEHSTLAQQQLQRALDSRIVIEQAKGFVAHTHHVGTDEAFTLLRDHARAHQERLADVALAVIERRLVLP